MTFEVGPSPDCMQVVYKRDPYDFNDQRIDATDMILQAGQHTRLTCNYSNTNAQTVVYRRIAAPRKPRAFRVFRRKLGHFR